MCVCACVKHATYDANCCSVLSFWKCWCVVQALGFFLHHIVCVCACVKKCFKIGNVQKCGWNVRVCYTCRLQIHIIMIIIIICKHRLHLTDIYTSSIIFGSLHTSLKNYGNIEKLHDLHFFYSCHLNNYNNWWWFACFMLSIIVLWFIFFNENEIAAEPPPVRRLCIEQRNKLWFCQVRFVNKCFYQAIRWQRYQISSFSLLCPFSFAAKSMFVRKIIALKIERSLRTLHPSQSHLLSSNRTKIWENVIK